MRRRGYDVENIAGVSCSGVIDLFHIGLFRKTYNVNATHFSGLREVSQEFVYLPITTSNYQ